MCAKYQEQSPPPNAPNPQRLKNPNPNLKAEKRPTSQMSNVIELIAVLIFLQ